VLEIAPCAEATIDGGIILIEQVLVLGNEITGFWYDIQRTPKRVHNLLYSDIAYLAEELLELDIDVETLYWRVSGQTVDLSTCSCKECEQFRVDNHLPPLNATRLQLFWYHIAQSCESIYWQIRCQCFTLRLRFDQWLLSHDREVQ
jgi:hypothetical protein